MSAPNLLPFSGDWETYVESVYQRYYADIIAQPPSIWGNAVKVRWNPVSKDKPFNFWHVISEGEVEEDRTPDLTRCARIGWIAWVLSCCDQNHECVRWYLSERSTSRGRKVNLVLWAHEENYVVIVEPRPGYALLVSAYPVIGRRTDKLQKEYDAFIAAPKPIPNW
jgi:hypothetical protein